MSDETQAARSIEQPPYDVAFDGDFDANELTTAGGFLDLDGALMCALQRTDTDRRVSSWSVRDSGGMLVASGGRVP